jgi:MFS family permease
MPARPAEAVSPRWFATVTRYQWLVLAIASLGWIFDTFEGQIFVASMREAMPSLLAPGTPAGAVSFYNNVALGAFLLGGAAGGVLFGALSDRIGRTPTMILTILIYSLFTAVTAASRTWWHMAAFRFLVALGVGGEWAVASAMVAEVFPKEARARSLGIFHGSSVLGTYLAVAAGVFIVANPQLGWRWGFIAGGGPALLTLWIRWKLREPDRWVRAREAAAQDRSLRAGRIRDLFAAGLRRRTLVGVGLASVGLATFWGVHVYGKDLLRRAAEDAALAAGAAPDAAAIKRAEMLGMLLATTGGGIGLLSFGPISERIGRRRAFVLFHLGGFAAALAAFRLLPGSPSAVVATALPLFGFLTLGMHAGYAIYFPELFPTRLRGTGGGFCFNVGRILAAPMLFASGWLQKEWGLTLEGAAALLSLLFLLGAGLVWFAPETRGAELPE